MCCKDVLVGLGMVLYDGFVVGDGWLQVTGVLPRMGQIRIGAEARLDGDGNGEMLFWPW